MTKLSLHQTGRDSKCDMSVLHQDHERPGTKTHQQQLEPNPNNSFAAGATIGTRQVHPSIRRHNRGQDFIKIQQLIDLTDKPIRLTREEIGWSRVRSSASNCICCCCNNSITLVTTDESYVLEHIPLDNIQSGQANASLQYLALANQEQLAVIDLIESNICGSADGAARSQGFAAPNVRQQQPSPPPPPTTTKLVNLASLGLTMADVLFWRWIDDFTLTLVTSEALYACRVDQPKLTHPALSALNRPTSQLLSLERVCDLRPNLGVACQITDVHRDNSGNLYAITGLYLKQAKQPKAAYEATNAQQNVKNNGASKLANNGSSLRPSFSSVPGQLSQMAGGEHRSLDSIKSENMSALKSLRRARKVSSIALRSSLGKSKSANNRSSQLKGPMKSELAEPGEVVGLTQIYCQLRDCAQLIQAHAVAFTTTKTAKDLSSSSPTTSLCSSLSEADASSSSHNQQDTWTTLVVANWEQNKLKVHFIGMATEPSLATSGQNVTRTIEFRPSQDDFPTSIVCTRLDQEDERAHLALITTKFGQLFVCSLGLCSVLFNVQISHDLVSGAVVEQKTRGLMIICRNGQVLLIRLLEEKLRQLLNETKSMCQVSSQCTFLKSTQGGTNSKAQSMDEFNNNNNPDHQPATTKADQSSISTTDSDSIDLGLEVLISTKL